jgi:hypothetical protein
VFQQVKNFEVLMEAIVNRHKYAFKGNEGFEVKDGSDDGKPCRKWLDIAGGSEDSRGLKFPMRCAQSPATNGACPFCHVVGASAHGNNRYITYVALLPPDSPLRLKFAKEFAGWAMLAERGTDAPRAMTLKEALKIGKQAEVLQLKLATIGKGNRGYDACEKEIGKLVFRGLNCFTRLFGEEYDFIKRMCNDLAHAIKNLVMDIIGLISNQGPMKFTPKKHAAEKAHGRFEDVT